jgi:Fic family protein
VKAPSPTPKLPLEDATALLVLLQHDLDDRDYLHWDVLRHKNPPAALTNKDWWFALKLRRSLNSRSLHALRGLNQRPARLTRHARIEAAQVRIDRKLGGFALTHGQPFSLAMRDQYLASSLMEEAIHSSIFEGAVSTRQFAKDMLRENRRPITHDERMIVNNYRAMQRIREMRDEPLSVDLVLELHRVLTTGAIEDPQDAGRLQRPGEPRVAVIDHRINRILHHPPPAAELEQRMARLINFANAADESDGDYLHPVLRSILLHFQLAFDHPFADGNGRTARALFYWSMLKRGYWLTEFISISRVLLTHRSAYERAYLHTESDDQDLTYFVLQQLNIIETAIDELHAYVRRKQDQQASLALEIDASWRLNPRQLALLAHALRTPTARYTHHSHANSHQVTVPTARADLMNLVDQSLLNLRHEGKTFAYRPTSDLMRRLRAPSARG